VSKLFEEPGESFLFEVFVGGECVGKIAVAHYDEAYGVAERIGFIEACG